MTLLRKDLLEVANQACEVKVAFTAVQLKQLLKLGIVGARLTQKIKPGTAQEIWEPDSWHKLSQKLSSCPRYKESRGLREMSEQIVRLLKTSKTKEDNFIKENDEMVIKRKAEDHDASETEKPAATTKRSKRKKVDTSTC